MTPRITWMATALTDVPTDDRWIDETMAMRLARMRYRKRRSETTLARWTAKAAIAATLDLPTDPASLRSVVVRNALDGAPYVEVAHAHSEVEIAMTDRADHAVCMVLAGHGRIGCDLELIEPRSKAFVADYFTPDERRAVSDGTHPELMANLIWSAKESALKVLRTGLRSDTRTVEVALNAVGGADGSWRPLTVTNTDGRVFPGWWLVAGQFVLTCATERPTDAPVSLTDPHGLIGAVPAHAWMDDIR